LICASPVTFMGLLARALSASASRCKGSLPSPKWWKIPIIAHVRFLYLAEAMSRIC
jgi:hypothetical protein